MWYYGFEIRQQKPNSLRINTDVSINPEVFSENLLLALLVAHFSFVLEKKTSNLPSHSGLTRERPHWDHRPPSILMSRYAWSENSASLYCVAKAANRQAAPWSPGIGKAPTLEVVISNALFDQKITSILSSHNNNIHMFADIAHCKTKRSRHNLSYSLILQMKRWRGEWLMNLPRLIEIYIEIYIHIIHP